MSFYIQQNKLKKKLFALYTSLNDPAVPWYVKLLLVLIIAYVVSPIDFIPDFIPVLGLLDEAILVPIGIALALKLMPEDVLEKYKNEKEPAYPKSLLITGILLVVLIWGMLITTVVLFIQH